jgi:hypothetical protein
MRNAEIRIALAPERDKPSDRLSDESAGCGNKRRIDLTTLASKTNNAAARRRSDRWRRNRRLEPRYQA